MRRYPVLAVASLLAFGLTACDGSKTATVSTTTPPVQAAGASTSTSVPGTASAVPISVPKTTIENSLTDVQAVSEASGDKVTFTFSGATPPGYQASYSDDPIQQGEQGVTIPVRGAAKLFVHFNRAQEFSLTGATGTKSYTGPEHVIPSGTAVVTEAVDAHGSESDLYWAIGTNSKAPFKVTTSTAPSRVVFEFPK